jgi:hypothetical protein
VRQAPGGESAAIADVEPGTRLAASSSGELLISKLEVCGNYSLYYDLYRLAADGSLARISECGRYRFAVPLEDGRIVALRFVGGASEVVLLGREGMEQRVLYRGAPGEAVTGLDARGETVVMTTLRDGRWSLVEITGGMATVLVSDSAVKHFPRYAEPGNEIYFIGDYGNVSNVWSWRRGDGRLARWSGALNGVLEISAPAAGAMLATTIEADGGALRLLRLPEAPLEIRGPDAAVDLVQNQPAQSPAPEPDRPYSPWPSLMPTSWLPAAYIADGAFALGFQTSGQDALGLHLYTLAPLYEFTQQQGLGSASWVYNDRHGVLLNRFMTVKTSVADDQKSTGRDITAYTINEMGGSSRSRPAFTGGWARPLTGKCSTISGLRPRQRVTSACWGWSPGWTRAGRNFSPRARARDSCCSSGPRPRTACAAPIRAISTAPTGARIFRRVPRCSRCA